MSQRKRSRPSDGDNVSDSELSDAPSGVSGSPGKRSRLSTDPTDSDTEDFDASKIYGVDEEDFQDDDGDEEDEENEEEEVEKKFGNAKEVRPEDNKPADYGVILRFECFYFMCHKALKIDLGPHINFIIGQNGSGKSAILTGITLCLGGKPSSTNRGGSLKAFIKTGEDRAKLMVRIKNKGEGFKRELYGDYIQVERTFGKEGGSSFKLKGDNGKIVSVKREELEEICDFMSLQVDNPMTILSQDNARQFLSNSSDSEKYKLFMKGVQLEQLSTDYLIFSEFIDRYSTQLNREEGHLGALEEQKNEAERRQKEIRQTKKLRQNILQKYNELAWVQVVEREKELEQAKIDRDTQAERLQGVEARLLKEQEKFEAVTTKISDLEDNIERKREEARPARDRLGDLKEDFNATRAQIDNLRAEAREAHSQKEKSAAAVQDAKKKIDEERQRLDGGGIVNEKERAKEEREEKLRQLENDRQAFQASLKECEPQQAALKSQLKAKDEEVRRKTHEINECENKMRNIGTGRFNDAQIYGANMPQVLQAIRNDRGWKEEPIGPVGKYVRVKDQEWGTILESIFGANLNGFVVTSYEDKDRLYKILKSFNMGNVPVSKINTGPMRLNEPSPEFLTSLRALEFDHDYARRYLVMSSFIDQSLLVETMEEGMELARRMPQYVRNIYVKHETRPGNSFKVTANSSSPVRPWGGKPRMNLDVSVMKRNLQTELASLKSDHSALESELHEIKRKLEDVQGRTRNGARREREFRDRRQRLEDEIEQLSKDIQEFSKDSELESMETTLKLAEKELQSYEGQIEDQRSEMDRLNGLHAEKKKAVDECRAECEKADEEIGKLSNKQQELQKEKSNILDQITYWQNKKVPENDKLQDLEQKVQEKEEMVQEYTEKANGFSPRVPIPRGATTESVGKEYERLQTTVANLEKRLGGTADEIAEQAEKAARQYDNARRVISQNKKIERMLLNSYMHRRYRWNMFQRYISARARHQFIWLMAERAFKGRLKMDHKKKELKLMIQPNQTDKGKGKGPANLSGGEKSFSLICLLLALWEAMGSQIRALDEFDVFMDAVNRKISVNMLINCARRSIGKQFILITPQDMSSITEAADVKIQRLANPDRSQGVLPFANGGDS